MPNCSEKTNAIYLQNYSDASERTIFFDDTQTHIDRQAQSQQTYMADFILPCNNNMFIFVPELSQMAYEIPSKLTCVLAAPRSHRKLN